MDRHTQTHTHTDIRTERILRNQPHTGHRLERAWFKTHFIKMSCSESQGQEEAACIQAYVTTTVGYLHGR